MKIAISGASGFIGSHLAGYLTAQGHQVVPLGRGYFSGFPAPGPGVIGDRAWDGAMGRLVAALEGCGAVVNLAGAPIDRRWSDTYKEELYASRIGPTRRLVEAIGALETPPGVLVSASAVGYYPAEGCYKETDARKGTGFLSDLCAAWEQEAQRVPPGVRLVVTRFGVVFSPGGGAFPRLARPFRMGIAARLGDGSQNVSWIALEDLVRAIGFVLEDAAVRGTVNMVAPQHLTNAELTGALARHYRVSLRVGVPGWIVRAIYGEAAQVLLSGQCAVPEKLTAAGFTFDAENIERFLERSAPLGK